MQRFFVLGTLTSLLANLAVPPSADPSGLRALQQYDERVTSIGYRLAIAGGDLCSDKRPLAGFVLHDLAQYPASAQDDARATFGFAGEPLVLAVAPASPAAAAGLREGDALLAIDGAPVPPATRGQNSYARMEALLAQLDSASVADAALDLELRRAGRMMTLQFAAKPGCASRYQTRVSTTVDSVADGTNVETTTGLVDFAGDEAQLAAIIAHELAHNILRHRARLDAKGIRRGLLGQFGRSARMVRQTEVEADILSVYLLDRAGYSPQAIIAFWQHYDRSHILGFLAAPTHPSPKARIAMVERETARIAAMKAAGESPRPAFMMGATLPDLR